MQGFGGSTYRPSYRHPGVATCSLGNPGPILGSAATGTARSAVGGSFQTFLAEHRARATGVSLSHRPDELLFNNSATRALYDQDVHLLEAWVCQRVRINVVSGQSDMTGCSPAGVGPEAASWRSVG